MLDRRYFYKTRAAAAPVVPTSTPYANMVAALGGVALWPLQGAVTTDVINARNLTWNNAPASVAGPGGELALAADFDMTNNEWGSVSHADLRPTTAVSVIAWANARSSGSDRGVVACGDTGYQGWRLTQSGTAYTFQVKNGTDTLATVVSDSVLSVDGSTFYFLAGVYNKTDVRLYINSYLDVIPAAATFDIGYSSNVCYIANWDGNTARDFDGPMAGAAVFPTALTAQNISDLYGTVVT